MRVGVELISGVFVGVVIGYYVDTYFDSSPWGLIVFMVLGSAAGFLNVYRVVARECQGDGEKSDEEVSDD